MTSETLQQSEIHALRRTVLSALHSEDPADKDLFVLPPEDMPPKTSLMPHTATDEPDTLQHPSVAALNQLIRAAVPAMTDDAARFLDWHQAVTEYLAPKGRLFSSLTIAELVDLAGAAGYRAQDIRNALK